MKVYLWTVVSVSELHIQVVIVFFFYIMIAHRHWQLTVFFRVSISGMLNDYAGPHNYYYNKNNTLSFCMHQYKDKKCLSKLDLFQNKNYFLE